MRMRRKWNPCALLLGMKWYRHYGKQCAGSLKIKLLYHPSILLLGIYTKIELKVGSERDMNTYFHSSIIHNSQEVEAIQMSLNE